MVRSNFFSQPWKHLIETIVLIVFNWLRQCLFDLCRERVQTAVLLIYQIVFNGNIFNIKLHVNLQIAMPAIKLLNLQENRLKIMYAVFVITTFYAKINGNNMPNIHALYICDDKILPLPKSFSAVVTVAIVRSQYFHFTWNKLDGYAIMHLCRKNWREIQIPLLNVNNQYEKWQVLWRRKETNNNVVNTDDKRVKPKWQFICLCGNKYDFLECNCKTVSATILFTLRTQLLIFHDLNVCVQLTKMVNR